MIQDQVTPPHDIAVSLYEQGKPTDEIGAALVASGLDQAAADAYLKGLHLAVLRFNEEKPAAEVWSALVSSGMEQAAAEALVKRLLALREKQLEEQRREEEHVGSGFCKECYAESSWESPGNIRTLNGSGRMFYGRARECKACRSAVSVLWGVFCFVPVIPLGSYRYRRVGDASLTGFGGKFIARRTRTRVGQVLTHYGAVLAVCALFVVVFMLAERMRH